MLNISTWVARTKTLGPGKRAVVWLQGCRKTCEGCISPEMRPFVERNLQDPVKLANMLIGINDIQGITISGGEPLEQSNELLVLLRYIKENSSLNTMVYSGFTLEEIEAERERSECLKHIDLLIDGQFDEKLPKAKWRGSINQRILSPTRFFTEEEIKAWTETLESPIEFHISEGNIATVGIPERGFIEDFKRRLKEKGINIR